MALWVGGLVMMASVLGSLGCPGGGATVGDVVGGDITAILEELNSTVVIRVVNLTDLVVELDVTVDGLPRTLRCPQLAVNIGQEICDFPLPECPLRIEATRLRLLDTGGGFSGGQNYFGDEGFSFTRGQDYSCGQFILYRFTADSSEARVLH